MNFWGNPLYQDTKWQLNVTECIVCVQGHDPLAFSFLSSFLFFDLVGILWPQLSEVLKLLHWASRVPFPPVSLQRQVVCLLLRPVFISGESLHCFLVGVKKSYVIATSDLWLFIHASNLLPSLPTPAPLHKQQLNSEQYDVELRHLSGFGWTVFLCPVIGRMLVWWYANILLSTGHENNIALIDFF